MVGPQSRPVSLQEGCAADKVGLSGGGTSGDGCCGWLLRQPTVSLWPTDWRLWSDEVIKILQCHLWLCMCAPAVDLAFVIERVRGNSDGFLPAT